MKRLLYIGNKLSEHGFTPTSIETLGPLLEEEGYVLAYASSERHQVLRFFDMVRVFLKSRRQIDFVLIDTYSTRNFWYAVVIGYLAKRSHIRYIPILRGGDLPNRLLRSTKTAQRLFGDAYVNIAPSNYLAEAFRAFGVSNLEYIPNTIILEKYPLHPKVYEVPHLLWVRSFAGIYNPRMAVDVLEHLRLRFPEATLTMIGPDKDGSLALTQAYATQKQLDVVFTGRLSKSEWIAYSERCNVFINTTDFDNTPVSVMEAMALGFPVVSTNVGGVPFLLEDGVDAVLVHPNDSAAMSEAVVRLLEDAVYREKIRANALQKAQTWDWNSVKKLWKSVLG